MPIVNTNFVAGRMNKSVDERLLPPGEYVDAINVRLGSTETTEIGAVENSKGNSQLTTLKYNNSPLTDGVCIGAYEDGEKETVYWFVASATADMIVSYNTNSQLLRYHVVSTSVLNFDSQYLITGVNNPAFIFPFFYFSPVRNKFWSISKQSSCWNIIITIVTISHK